MNQTSYDLSQNSDPSKFPQTGGSGELGFEYQRLSVGKSAGVERVKLVCGCKEIDVLPTRGMGIWQAEKDGVRFGWASPIDGPVHPMWVDTSEPSGLGWLDGFDEMMVRCGLANNGAPEFDANGQLLWPLHGRIANLPASSVVVNIDESRGRITIRGTVHENRFHFRRLKLETEIGLQADTEEISIVDRVTNLSDRQSSIQMLYHNNFGSPILESGSKFFAPIKKLVPRNDHAAQNIEDWNLFSGPDSSFAEQVYFMELAADGDNQTMASLANSDESKGVYLRWDVASLPCFSLWKNTVGDSDGYVAGLEPATNFPNPRSFEEAHQRVVSLAPGESHTMSLNIGLLASSMEVAEALATIQSLAIDQPEILDQPTADWCSN